MKIRAFITAALIAISAVTVTASTSHTKPMEAITVVHTPNPCPVNKPLNDYVVPNEPYVWYYRTAVHNNLKVPICVVRFNVSHIENGQWVDSNIRGRMLGAEDFAEWYGEGIMVNGGEWIPPGGAAVCHVNWSAMDQPTGGLRRWWYIARDQKGNVYRGEGIVTLLPGDSR